MISRSSPIMSSAKFGRGAWSLKTKVAILELQAGAREGILGRSLGAAMFWGCRWVRVYRLIWLLTVMVRSSGRQRYSVWLVAL
jgi:hypothetical protein